MSDNKGSAVFEPTKEKKSRVIKLLTAAAVFCLIIYSVFTIISQQAQIAQLKKQSEDLSAKITEAKQQNDEYIRVLSSDDEAEYIERIAIERLGYAYPNERRFYVVDGK
ncbi:MAG: septum formation initiator family protein [Oscillospiraceae bacterium]